MKNLSTNLTAEKDILAEAEKIIKKANATNEKKVTKNKTKKNTKTRKKVIIISLVIFIAIILLTLSVIFAVLTNRSDKIISGISINSIDISNLSKAEALEKLNAYATDNISTEITLTHNEYTTTLDLSTIEANYDIESAVEYAYNIGRSENNIFANNAKIISTYFNNQNITPTVSYNSDLLEQKVSEINNELPDKVVNSSYTIENNNLIISNSANGYQIDTESLSNYVIDAILGNTTTIELPVEEYEADTINLEAIYNEIYVEAQDAYYTTDPYEIHEEVVGLDFAITLDEAKAMLEDDTQESYTIPLKTVNPSVTVEDFPQEAFPDLLATFSTTYATSNTNRATNISLATNSVNGYVLMPDETFSYNDVVGERTAARGYKEAAVYLNGEVTTGLGGGICQVSTTLYNAVLLSNLEVVERTNHTFQPGYVPSGQDATVSWGGPDFKFKNNRSYPIKLVATAVNGQITFYIYGLKSDDDYEVQIVSNQIATIEYETEYQKTSSLASGVQKVSQSGSNGCKTETYKILYKDGVEVSRTLISSDTYKPHNRIVLVGTASSSSSSSSSGSSNNNSESTTNESSTSSSDSTSSSSSDTDFDISF